MFCQDEELVLQLLYGLLVEVSVVLIHWTTVQQKDEIIDGKNGNPFVGGFRRPFAGRSLRIFIVVVVSSFLQALVWPFVAGRLSFPLTLRYIKTFSDGSFA